MLPAFRSTNLEFTVITSMRHSAPDSNQRDRFSTNAALTSTVDEASPVEVRVDQLLG